MGKRHKTEQGEAKVRWRKGCKAIRLDKLAKSELWGKTSLSSLVVQ